MSSRTRYSPEEGVFLPVPQGHVSPVNRSPLGQKAFLLYAHLLLIPPLALFLALLWYTSRFTGKDRPKAMKWHKRAGYIFAPAYITWLCLAWALQYQGARQHHATQIFPPQVKSILTVAGFVISHTAIHLCWRWLVPRPIVPWLVLSHVYAIQLAVRTLARCIYYSLTDETYLGGISTEGCGHCIAFLFFELTLLGAACQWWRHPDTYLPLWKKHHVTCACFMTMQFLGVPIVGSLAHDATHLWEYPGLPLQGRMLFSLCCMAIPFLTLVRPHLKTITEYQSLLVREMLAICQEAPTELRETIGILTSRQRHSKSSLFRAKLLEERSIEAVVCKG